MNRAKVKKAIVCLEKGAEIIGEPQQMNYTKCALACLLKGLGTKENERFYLGRSSRLNRAFGIELVKEIEERFEGWEKFKNNAHTIPQVVEALQRKLRYSRTLS